VSSNSIPSYLLRTTEPASSRQPTVPATTATSAGAPLRSPAEEEVLFIGSQFSNLSTAVDTSVTGSSVYRGSKQGRRVIRRPRRAASDCPTPGERGAVLTLVRFEMRPGLTAGALGPSIVSLNANKSTSSSSSESGESLRHVGCYSAKCVWESRP
jgi:hypothetical protein